MLRILTLIVCLLCVASWNDFFSISSWANLSQDTTDIKDTTSNPKRVLALVEQESDKNRSTKPEKESEKKLVKKPAQAIELLRKSREKLLSYNSISAQITEKVEIGPKTFVMRGSYLQGKGSGGYLKGKGLKLRLEFQVQNQKKNGEPVGKLLEICDGQILWKELKIKGNLRVTRRDVQAILKQAELNPQSRTNMLVAELGLGGLPGLLAAIQKNMKFESVSERMVNGKSLTVLNGSWKDEFLAQLKGGDPNSTAQLPAYVPKAVRIYLDPKTLFPRRIVYLKQKKGVLENMVTLNFTKITLNAPIEASKFTYVPSDGVFPVNTTLDYINQLKQ